MALMIYGCTGYMGTMVSEVIAQHPQLRQICVLSGRSKAKVQSLANRLSLPWCSFKLTDPVMDHFLRDVKVVLNMAGPYVETTEPLIMSCIRTNTNYLDISKEQQSLQLLFQTLSTQIQSANITAIPGLGFDSVATDCLAALLLHHLPSATHLNLSYAFSNFADGIPVSRGIWKSNIRNMFSAADMNLACIDGVMREVPLFYKSRSVTFPNAGKTLVATAGGANCYIASRSTQIENIDTYLPIDVNIMRLILFAWRIFAFLLRWIPLMHWFILHVMDYTLTKGPSEYQRKGKRIDVWGEVREANQGRVIRGSIQVMEAYGFAQQAAIQGILRMMQLIGDRQTSPGVWTPSQAFGPEFVLSIPGTVAYTFVKFEHSHQTSRPSVTSTTNTVSAATAASKLAAQSIPPLVHGSHYEL
ncbi:Saccharopine dehydrogenase-domain-containing protein [Umbelopsis sp. PMI_123]|nr:Saccharopine dehydrogenase-domain-containing protein [Umbelopsis sp. PMI_123]